MSEIWKLLFKKIVTGTPDFQNILLLFNNFSMSKNVKISTDKVFEDFPQYGDTGWISVKSMSISVPNEITFFDIGAELDKFF